MARIIHIVGLPATGKTTLRKALAKALHLPSYGIDEERIALLRPGRWWPDDDSVAWRRLASRITGDCIIETGGADHGILDGHQVITICCKASLQNRGRRLQQRKRTGYPLSRGQRDYVQRLLHSRPPSIEADIEWNGDVPQPLSVLLPLLTP